MTSEKKSTLSLKQWVRRIKRYEYELPLLYEKLEYLKVKSIGYHSPSFDPRLSSNGSFNHKGIDYWLEKIEKCEDRISYLLEEISIFKNFLNKINSIQKNIILQYFDGRLSTSEIIKNVNVRRSMFYKELNEINRIFSKNYFKSKIINNK